MPVRDKVTATTIYRLRAMAHDDELNPGGHDYFVAATNRFSWEEYVGVVILLALGWLLYFANTHTFPW